MKEKTLFTKYSKHFNDLVKETLVGKSVSYEMETGATGYVFYYEAPGNIFVSDASLSKNEFPQQNSTEISQAEFLGLLEALPEAEGEEYDLNGYEVSIAKEGVSIGCHDFSPEDFAKIEKAVDQVKNGIVLKFAGRRDIVINAKGIHADDDDFSFSDFEKIKASFDRVNKK